MSHHYSGPNFGFPHGDARLDFTDIFEFPKPGDPTKSILIADFHPSATAIPPGPTTKEPFATKALYEIKIDTNGDAIAEVAYRIKFSPAANGGQTATLRRVEGPQAAGTGEDGQIIVENAPVSMDDEAYITDAAPYRFFAGWRSDPFFFDVGGALNNFAFTGEDSFADKNIASIAIELPNSALGAKKVGLWVRTLDGSTGTLVQADRGARSSQTPFLAGDDRLAYLAAMPDGDARFIDTFAHRLEHAGGYTPDEAKRVASAMFPDIVSYDPSLPVAYPKNGRTLTDDVADYFVSVLTNNKFTTDKVGPHKDLLAEFPFVGRPHAAALAASS